MEVHLTQKEVTEILAKHLAEKLQVTGQVAFLFHVNPYEVLETKAIIIEDKLDVGNET